MDYILLLHLIISDFRHKFIGNNYSIESKVQLKYRYKKSDNEHDKGLYFCCGAKTISHITTFYK